MGHELDAFVVGSNDKMIAAVREALPDAHVASLPQGLSLVPLTDPVLGRIERDFTGKGISGPSPFPHLTPAMQEAAVRLSAHGRIAYLWTFYFGGDGNQGAIGWHKGKVAILPDRSDHPINDVLRWLGVKLDHGGDEFDAMGLGWCRKTEYWIPGTRRPTDPP